MEYDEEDEAASPTQLETTDMETEAATPVTELLESGGLREVGSLAVWSVTSAKPGNGVQLLRDDRDDTYWQSDGTQPHLVNIQFQKKVRLQQVSLYLDYRVDESYTPNRIAIRAGTSFYDLKEVKVVELEEPKGWVTVPLVEPGGRHSFMRAFMVQVAVLSNHQNGRDTHIRKVKVFGPRADSSRALGRTTAFSSLPFQMRAVVR
eukprot:jgi/Tetstr1/458890/TSEL_004397.t1